MNKNPGSTASEPTSVQSEALTRRVDHLSNLGLEARLKQTLRELSVETDQAEWEKIACRELLTVVAEHELQQERRVEEAFNLSSLELKRRPHSTASIARNLGIVYANKRNDPSISRSVVKELLAKWEIEVELDKLFEAVNEHIREDRVYDSEANQAIRAFTAALNHLYGATIDARGWIPGDMIKVGRNRFELTGNLCPKCEGPEAYGVGGGFRCADVEGCGWWFCR